MADCLRIDDKVTEEVEEGDEWDPADVEEVNEDREAVEASGIRKGQEDVVEGQ